MKSIFITGAASGIGRATALLFARKGWFVGLFDINEKDLQSLAAEIGEANCCFQKLDVVKTEAVKAALDFFAKKTSGAMDALFNCAGILRMGYFEEIPLEKQIKIVEINLIGVVQCTHLAFPLLKSTPGARVITMSSASSAYGVPEMAVYSATKFAVRGLTEALDIEFERHGIKVSDIVVPYVNTPMLEQERKAISIEKLGIDTSPEEVAEMVWNATFNDKLHWSKGQGLLKFIFWLLPFARRGLMKKAVWEDPTTPV